MRYSAQHSKLPVVLFAVLALGLCGAFSARAATIKSVQKGTTGTLAGFNNAGAGVTVTLPTAVDSTKSFVIATWNFGDSQCKNYPTVVLSTDGTNLNFKNTSAVNIVANWQVLEFSSGVSVQRGVENFLAADALKSVTITSAPLTTSFALVTTRWTADPANNTFDEEGSVTAKLFSATQLELQRTPNTTPHGIDVAWQVITFTDGASTVIQGETILTGGTDATKTATVSVNAAKSFLVFTKRNTGTGGLDGSIYARGTLNAAGSLLTFDRQSTTGTLTVNWYLITMPDIVSSQQATGTLGNTNASTTVTSANLPTAITNTSRTAIFTSYQSSAGANAANEGDELTTIDLLNGANGGPNSVTISRPNFGTVTAGVATNTFIVEFAGAPVTTLTWNGSTSVAWSNAANWNIGGGPASRAPQSGDNVVLTGAGTFRPTNMDIASLSLNNVTFDSTTTSPVTVAAVAPATNLTLTSGIIIDPAAANHTISLPVVLSGSVTVTTGPAAGNFTLSSALSGGGALNVAGSGTLNFNMANVHTGGTSLFGGTVPISASSTGAVGAVTSGPFGTGTLTFGGGTLMTTGAIALTINNGMASSGNIVISGTADLTLGGAIGTVGNRSFNIGNGMTVFGGVISGSGPLVKDGTGLMRVNVVSAMAGGGEIVNAGTLQPVIAQTFPSLPLTVNQGATFDLSLTGNTTTAVGNGKITLTGGTIKLGTAFLKCESLGADGFTCTSAGGLKAQITGTAPGGVNLGDTFRDFTVNAGGTDPDFEISAVVQTGTNTTNPLLTKKGAGTLVFSGTNTYSQPTQVSAGTMRITGTYAASAQVLTGSTLTVNGGTLVIANSYTTPAATTLTTTATPTFGTLQLTGTGSLSTASIAINGTAVLPTTLLVDGNSTVNAFPTNVNVTMTGGVIEVQSPLAGTHSQTIGAITATSGTGILKATNLGAGTATLAPTSVTAGGGTLQFTGAGALSTGGVSVSANGTFLVDLTASAINPLIGNPAITFGGGTIEIDASTLPRTVNAGAISITNGTNVLKLVNTGATVQVASSTAFNRTAGTLEFTTPGFTPPSGAKLTATGTPVGIVSFATVNGSGAQYDAANGLVPATIPVFTSVLDGDWSIPATWGAATAPTAGSNVVIKHAVVNLIAPTAVVNEIKLIATAAGSTGTGLTGTQAVNTTYGFTIDAGAPATLNVTTPLNPANNAITLDVQGAAGTLQLSGAITGTAGLNKIGPGKLLLASANVGLSGPVLLSAGVTETQIDSAFGSGAITLTGTWQTTTNNQANTTGITLAGTTPALITDKNLTCTGAVAGPATALLNKSGAGRLILSGAKGYAGGTSITAGSAESTIDGATGTGGITINNATLAFTTNNQNLNASVILTGTNATIDVAAGLTLTQAATGTSLSNATAGYTLTKAGPGALVLTEAGGQLRNFTGANAVLEIQNGTVRSNTTGNVIGNQIVNLTGPGAVFDDSFGDGENLGFIKGIAGTTLIQRTAGAANIGIGMTSGTAQVGTFAGLFTSGTNGVLGADSTARNSSVGLTINGAAHELTLTNPANNFAGQINLSANAKLIFSSIAKKGAACAIGDGNFNATLTPDISLGAGAGSAGILTYTGPSASSDRTIVIANVGGGIFEVLNANTVLTLTGAITEGTALSPFTKNGPGTLALAAACTYTGATTVNDGALQLNIGGSLAGAVSVAGPASLRGSGVVNGAVSGTGRIWPGTSTAVSTIASDESLTVSSANLSSGAKLALVLNNALNKKQSLTVTGALTLGGGSVLSLAFDTPATAPRQFTIVTSGAGGINTPFSVILANTMVYGTDFDVIYTDGGANTFTSPAPGALPAAVNQIIVRFNNTTITPVSLDTFNAAPDGAGVLLKWNCVSEFKNAGFNLYRRAVQESGVRGQDSGWTRINTALIPGRITNPDPKQYAFYDWPLPGTYEYKLESVSINGVREEFETRLGVTLDGNVSAVSARGIIAAASDAALAVDAADLMRSFAAKGHTELKAVNSDSQIETRFFRLVRGATPDNPVYTATLTSETHTSSRTMPIVADPPLSLMEIIGKVKTRNGTAAYDPRKNTIAMRDSVIALDNTRSIIENLDLISNRRESSFSATAQAGVRWFSRSPGIANNFTAAKVVYSAPGVLEIPQRMLPTGFDAGRVGIQREGRGLKTLAMTANGIVVFAPGYADEYTDKDALFLRRTAAPTAAGTVLRAQGLFESTQPINVSTSQTVMASFHDVYFDFDVRPYSYEPWFSAKYLSGGSVQRFTLDTPRALGTPATLTIVAWSLTDTPHALQVAVNGQPVSESQWSGGGRMVTLTFDVGASVLNNGANTIDLLTPALPGAETQIALLHSITAEFSGALDASKPLDVVNTSNAAKLLELYNLPSTDAWVVDARFADRAVLVPYETQAQADGTFKLRFSAPAGGSGRFVVVPAGQENRPLSVSKRTVRATRRDAYLAVGPAQFGPGVQPLLLVRAREGIRGSFADQEQIFDYYNHGRYGPVAIQNAVRATRPQYLLLLGRTTYDYRNYSGRGVDPLCPAFLVSTSFWAQATSDSQFGDLGRGYPEVAVGRLPVNNAAELSTAVARIAAYKGMSISGGRVHAAADRTDPSAGDFAAQAQTIAQASPEFAWQSNYLGTTYATAPEVTAAMRDAANGGADVLLYVGHGNAARLGKDDPRILQTDNLIDNVRDWTGSAVFLQATCTGNWMAKNETGFRSIATQALTQPQGGISASIGTSTYMNSDAAAAFMSQVLRSANASGARWGSALLKTQQWAMRQSGSAFYQDLGRTEQLFGDPAMRVHAAPAVNSGGTTINSGTF